MVDTDLDVAELGRRISAAADALADVSVNYGLAKAWHDDRLMGEHRASVQMHREALHVNVDALVQRCRELAVQAAAGRPVDGHTLDVAPTVGPGHLIVLHHPADCPIWAEPVMAGCAVDRAYLKWWGLNGPLTLPAPGRYEVSASDLGSFLVFDRIGEAQ